MDRNRVLQMKSFFCVLTSQSLKPYCQQYSSLLNKFLVSALWLLDCLDAAKVFALNYKKTKYIAFPAGKICFLSFDLFMGKYEKSFPFANVFEEFHFHSHFVIKRILYKLTLQSLKLDTHSINVYRAYFILLSAHICGLHIIFYSALIVLI